MIIDLQAGVEFVHRRVGNAFRIMNAAADVKIGTDDAPPTERYEQGTGRAVLGGFEKLRIISDTTQQIDIAVSDGEIYDSRLSLSAPVTIARGATLATAAASIGTSAALLLDASATRRSVFIMNNSTTATLYVGASAAVTAANGWPIPPKGGLSLDQAPGAAVYAIASAAATDVRTLTESD